MSTTKSDGPLSPEQQEELALANARAQKILAATKVATFNGWTIGAFAAITLLFALFSLTALVIGVALAIVARNEFRGRGLLRRFDARGPQLLGWNQVGFMTLIIAYSVWSIYGALTNPLPQLEELEAVLGTTEDLITNLTVAVYAVVIVLTLLFQGLNARYYFARIKLVQEYLEETPAWIIDLQHATAAL
jgi:hypothetical protein